MSCKSRFIPCILVLFMLQLSVEAQKHPQLRFIGFTAGMNMAGIRSDLQYDRNKKNFGANINLSANYSFSDSKSIGASLSFEQKGAVDHIYDIKTNINYASLPVYFELITGKEPRFIFTAGVYPAWLISANNRGNKLFDGQSIRVDEDASNNFKSFDFGFLAGTGILIRLYDDFDFLVNIRSSVGLINIKETMQGSRPKNYHFSISIGYIYYIGFR